MSKSCVKSEEDFLKGYPNLRELFALLRAELQENGAQSYTTNKAIRFKSNRVFAKAHFRKKHITIELKVGQRGITENHWPSHPPEWGCANIYPGKPIPDKIVKWIETARNRAAESQ